MGVVKDKVIMKKGEQAMRLIDADALDAVKFHPLPYTHITPSGANAESYKWGWNDAIDAIIESAPTIDPVVHGEWIYDMNTNLDPLYVCSRCGQWAFAGDKGKLPNYCENCGAKMEGDAE